MRPTYNMCQVFQHHYHRAKVILRSKDSEAYKVDARRQFHFDREGGLNITESPQNSSVLTVHIRLVFILLLISVSPFH